MRSTLGAALFLAFVFFVCVAPLHSQSGELELAPRHGPFPRAFLKGCAKLSATAVDFDGSGDRFQVEWWRCGPRTPNRQDRGFPGPLCVDTAARWQVSRTRSYAE